MLVHQLDQLYVTSVLLDALSSCDTGSPDHIFGQTPMLSDHLPIADLTSPT